MPRQSRKSTQNAVNAVAEIPTPPTVEISMELVEIPTNILRFLNELPMMGDVVQWIEGFRDALRKMLGDVDRVTVSVNTNCDLINPEKYLPHVAIKQYPQQMGESSETVVASLDNGSTPSQQVLEDLRQLGHSLDGYYPPNAYDYYYAGCAYLGTILLFRERSKSPISEKTNATMHALQNFMNFALSDLVTRNYYFRPINRVFYDILIGLVREAGLSMQDIRILSYMLLGYSYKQVGDRMKVTIDTVRKHMKRIYRKTKTGSLAELFAKYFTPRLGIQGLGEDEMI